MTPQEKAKCFLEAATTTTFYQKKMDAPHNIQMDVTSTTQAPVPGQTPAMVSLDTNALIAAHQGVAWKINRWTDNIAIYHTKGCACCHKYINHLHRAQSVGQVNLLHSNIGNAVRSARPSLINDIEIKADEWV